MKPSVSNLIDLLDKPALMRWANKIGLQGIPLDDYKSKSKSEGTDYHLAVENFLKFGMLSEEEGFNNKMQSFFKDKEILGSEVSIEHELFLGRYDVKLKWKDFVFVCDFKSGKSVYFETKLQLAAYAMVEKCHVAVVKIPDFILHPITYDVPVYEEMITLLARLWELKSRA